LPSSWWCSSWSISVGAFFLDLFCDGIVNCFSAETWWAPMLGVWKIGGNPEHVSLEQMHKSCEEETKNLWKPVLLRSWEPLYTCPHAPFYRETKGLLHSKNTLKSNEYS
jgi:hypothetical protein